MPKFAPRDYETAAQALFGKQFHRLPGRQSPHEHSDSLNWNGLRG